MSKQARFVLVERKTRLTELVERFNTWDQAKFYLERSGLDVSDYLAEHDQYKAVLVQVETLAKQYGRVARIERLVLDTYQFHSEDIVLVVGQDGLVANTIKYLSGQPVLGVNPDAQRWDGQLLGFNASNIEEGIRQLLQGKSKISAISLAEARSNDGQRMLAVNDLFIGPKTHSSARYQLSWQQQAEVQSSSGIIVSTGLGRTGWLQSILTGAAHTMNPGNTQCSVDDLMTMQWRSDYLYFAVREPFPSRTTGTNMVVGKVDNQHPLQLTSYMPGNGVVFSDGMENDAIEFNAGMVLTIGVAQEVGQLVC